MKKILFLLVFTTFTAFGQTYVDDSQVINTANLQTTNAQLNLASDQIHQQRRRLNLLIKIVCLLNR